MSKPLLTAKETCFSRSAEELLSKVALSSPTKICHLYSEGYCPFGDRCKFLHSGVPGVVLKQMVGTEVDSNGRNRRKVMLRHSDETSNRVKTVKLSGLEIWKSKKHYVELTKSLDEIYSNPQINSEFFNFRLEDFQLTDKLGKGGFAVVYKANYVAKNGHTLPSEVAVKKLPVELWEHGSPEEKANNSKYFAREVLNLRRVTNHPNITRILGICSEIPNVCIILEYMRSGSLHDIVHKQKVRLDGKNLIRVATHIADGMNYLHSLSIIHRDLHSGNVLVDGETVKITDFGLSMVIPENSRINIGDGCAHLRYGAPELFRDEPYGKASDVYQFGVLLWEVFTGQLYYGDKPIVCIANYVGRGERPEIPLRDALYQNVSPDHLEELMTSTEYDTLHSTIQSAWSNLSSDRPTFEQILVALRS